MQNFHNASHVWIRLLLVIFLQLNIDMFWNFGFLLQIYLVADEFAVSLLNLKKMRHIGTGMYKKAEGWLLNHFL